MTRQDLFFCDGSCLGNPGPGGWAYRVWQDRRIVRERSGTEQNTTKNRMEMRAVIEGLKSFPSASNIVVVSDSRYLISGMRSCFPSGKRGIGARVTARRSGIRLFGRS